MTNTMEQLKAYLWLPEETSPTEKAHVDRINRLALLLLACHIPVFALVAWICDTGPGFAVVLSAITVVGPGIAALRLRDNHRALAHVIAFTTMCMGGLLVHFGQGPMQIEMHFYFFVLLALLACYANPAVNLTAAVTAAVHHLTIWLLLPASVFNYDASFWVVAVHALFVVLETVAAVFIARSFYDNVIGLEKIIAARTMEIDQRNRDMKLVLDNVSQGLLTIDKEGRFGDERSQRVEEFMGAPHPSGSFCQWLSTTDERAGTWLAIGLEELQEDILPEEVILDQLPKRFRSASEECLRTCELQYRPIRNEEGQTIKLLVVITDITDQLRREAAEAEQKENLRLFELIASDPVGFMDFFAEADKMLRRLVDDHELSLRDSKRLVHTLKGNAAMYGLDRLAQQAHELEEKVETSGERLSADELRVLDELWKGLSDKVEELSGGHQAHHVSVLREDVETLRREVEAQASHSVLLGILSRLEMDPSHRRLDLLADQAKKIAERLGRRNIEIEATTGDVDIRFDSERWTAFWSSLVHVFRNAFDHGLEPESERQEAGKTPHGKLTLATYTEADKVVIAVRDDGRGVDVERLAERARKAGLSAETTEQILQAIFADGVTTRDAVTEISGRGVGMAAVKAEVDALGGTVRAQTEPGKGTSFEFIFTTGPEAGLFAQDGSQRAA